MQHDALIAAFRQLSTNHSRLNALEALAQELTSHEWRRLRDMAAAHPLQKDIIAGLPLELVAHVFAYLDTSTPYRLQRVSRTWRRVLHSSDVVALSLASWYGRMPDSLRAEYSLCRHRAQAIHRFRHGLPKHEFSVQTSLTVCQMMLRGHTLAFGSSDRPDRGPRELHLFDMHTWTMYSLQGDAREYAIRTFMSESIVGFTTNSNLCYVSDLQGRGKRKFRVPSTALFHSITCRARTVACAGCLRNHAEVYIWNYDTQQGRSFSLNFSSHLFPYPYAEESHKHGIALLLQPEAERVMVFTDDQITGERSYHSPKLPSIRYAQFNYDGQCVFESCFTMGDIPVIENAVFEKGRNGFMPVDDQGRFKISIGGLYNLAPAPRWVYFDERFNRFTPIERWVPPLGGEEWAARTDFCWKDTIYSILEEKSPPSALLFHMGTIDRRREDGLLVVQKKRGGFVYQQPRDSVVLNEKYLVYALRDGFCIFCFDDNPHYAQRPDVDFFGLGIVAVRTRSYHVQ